MELWQLLLDALVLVTAALILGAVMEAFRQSPVVGFMFAGVLVGPGALGLVRGESDVRSIAELGVALLLFSIGLEFNVGRLRGLGLPMLALGAGQVAATLTVITAAALGLGLSLETGVAFGAIGALSSTAVVLRVLSEHAALDSVHGRAAVGVLLVQDMAVVPLVLLVTALLPGSDPGAGIGPQQVLGRIGIGLLALVGLIGFTRVVLPRLLANAALSRSRELHILFAVATAIGSAYVSHSIGLSASLGAFVAGAILGDSEVALQVRADVAPLRTLFTTLFFGSVGMLAQPRWIADHGGLVALAVVALTLGKVLVVWPLGRLAGLRHGHAVAAGLCLAQVGEFSFVLAEVAVGRTGATGLLDRDQFALVISATIATLVITPYLVAAAPAAADAVERWSGRSPSSDGQKRPPTSGHVVIVGFGPAGRAAAAAVPSGRSAVIIDLNTQSVADARADGHHACFGDATTADVLEEAHVEAARAVVVALPDHRAAEQVIRRVRVLAPEIDIIARARYHIHAQALADAGATVVIDEEAEVGRRLGATVSDLGAAH
jgi:CPA2 family monovalent cation:H+ antiporter-2